MINSSLDKPKYWELLFASVILSFLSFLFYLPSLYYSFKFDDEPNITGFYGIRTKTLKDFFFSRTRWIAYWLNTLYYKIDKFNPFYYRLGNLAIHTISGILLFFIFYICLSRLKQNNFLKKQSFLISFTTAALFLLHPVQTQTITYVIQGQLEGLATLFVFGIILSFILSYTVKSKTLSIFFKLNCLILGVLSCGTKEIAIISPLLILLIDWFFISQGNIKKIKSKILFYILYSGLIWSLYIYLLKPEFFIKIFSLSTNSLENNIGNTITDSSNKITAYLFFISQFKVLLHYLLIFIWPFNISVDYDWILEESFFSSSVIIPLIILLTLSFCIYKRLSKNKTDIFSFSLLWFFIVTLPRSSFIPGTELLADYKTYMASGVILLLIATLIIKILSSIENLIKDKVKAKSNLNLVYLSSLSLIFLIIGYSTYTRNLVWSDAESFWLNILQNAPTKARAYNNYGLALEKQKKYYKAIKNFKKAIELDSKYPDPWINLSYVYDKLKEPDKALAAIKRSLEIYPTVIGYSNLAYNLIKQKKYKEALYYLKEIIKIQPNNGQAWYNLGFLYNELDQKEKCWEAFKNCCTKADYDQTDEGFKQYGLTSSLLGKDQDAIFAYQKALEINPSSLENILNLADMYYKTKSYNKALDLYQELLDQAPNETHLYYKIGICYEELKQYNKAIEYKEQFNVKNAIN